jgi:DNA-binding transcriptional LysR family regulator
MMQQLEGIMAFVTVVDEGGFSPAARRLGVAKSTISKRIRSLEDRLGARLLNRTTRSQSLTEVGAAYYERCSAIVDAAREAEAAVTHQQTTPHGRLRLSAPMSFGQRYLDPVIAEFLRGHPNAELELDLDDRTIDVVDEGYDLAIRIGSISESSLVMRELLSSRFCIVASPGYLAKRGSPHTPDELFEHDCLLYSYQRSGDSWRFDGPDGPLQVRVTGRMRANNGDALAQAASAGLGLALLPDFIVEREISAGRLCTVLDDWCQQRVAVHAVYPHNRHLSAKVRVFVDLLEAHLR